MPQVEHIQSLETSDPRGELDTVRSAVAKLCKLLQRDGYQYKNDRIIPVPSTASLHLLKEAAVVFNAEYLSDQVRRLEQSIDTDPAHGNRGGEGTGRNVLLHDSIRKRQACHRQAQPPAACPARPEKN